MRSFFDDLLINSRRTVSFGRAHTGSSVPSVGTGFVLMTHHQVFNAIKVAQTRKKRTAITRVTLRSTDEGEITRMVEYRRLMRTALVRDVTYQATYDIRQGGNCLPHCTRKTSCG